MEQKHRPMKRYLVTIADYGGHEVVAETASKARWKSVVAFQEAFGTRYMTTREILARMTTVYLGRAIEGGGDA